MGSVAMPLTVTRPASSGSDPGGLPRTRYGDSVAVAVAARGRVAAVETSSSRLWELDAARTLAIYLGHQAVLVPLVAAVLLAAGVEVDW